MGDFKFSNGNVKKGILAAIISAIVLLAAPTLILMIASGIGSAPVAFRDDARSLMTLVILIAIPTIALAFFRGHYPKGSVSRFVFGEAESVAVLLYLIVVLTSTYLVSALSALSYDLDANRLMLTAIYIVPLMAVGFVGQFFVHRREWLKSTGVERPVKPLPSGIKLDFSLRVGDPLKAIKDAKREALLLVIIPALILITLIPVVYAFSGGPLSPAVVALLTDLSGIVDVLLVLGVIALPLAYVRGFYPKGTFSRMILYVGHSLFLVYFIYAILVFSHLSSGISGIGVHFDYDLMVLLLMLIPLFSIFVAVGEVVDERKNWKESLGLAVKRKPLNTSSAFLDFNPRTGRLGDATKAVRRSYAFWLVIPLVALSIAAGMIRDSSSIIQNAALANAVSDIATRIAPISIIIVVLSFPWGFYPKGSYGRFVFGIATTPVLVLFVLSIFMGGDLQRALFNSGIRVDLNLVELLLLLYAVSFIIVPVGDLIDNRRAWKKRFGWSVKKLSPSKPGIMTDFRLRYARFLNGAREGRKAIVSFVIVPVVVLVVVRAALQSSGNPYVQQALTSLEGLDTRIATIGFLLAAVMFFRGLWGRGAFSRLSFGLVATLVNVLWTVTLIGGLDNVSAEINIPGGFSIDLSPYLNLVLILFVVLAAASGVKYAMEYMRHREEWLSNRESRVVE